MIAQRLSRRLVTRPDTRVSRALGKDRFEGDPSPRCDHKHQSPCKTKRCSATGKKLAELRYVRGATLELDRRLGPQFPHIRGKNGGPDRDELRSRSRTRTARERAERDDQSVARWKLHLRRSRANAPDWSPPGVHNLRPSDWPFSWRETSFLWLIAGLWLGYL
jgi:hypothetical protein